MNLVREKRHELEDLRRQIIANCIQRPVATLGALQESRLKENAQMI
ncbi:MAG: hypothetical protein NTV26_05040 [Caldiserica bacterium]|nr:hypothetical protein [Caldisericota bacterium]